MKIRIIEYGSLEYKASLKLREDILRKPLNLSLLEDDVKDEDKQVHFGVFFDERLVGCLVLNPSDNKQIKMRQLAVTVDARGIGCGKTLVLASEKYALSKGFQKIILNARKEVVEFYLKLGYSVEGDEFIAVKIPHFKMHKKIA